LAFWAATNSLRAFTTNNNNNIHQSQITDIFTSHKVHAQLRPQDFTTCNSQTYSTLVASEGRRCEKSRASLSRGHPQQWHLGHLGHLGHLVMAFTTAFTTAMAFKHLVMAFSSNDPQQWHLGHFTTVMTHSNGI